jgi:hypothetical protein
MSLPNALKRLKAKMDKAGSALGKVDPRSPRPKECDALAAELDGLKPLLDRAQEELRKAAGAGATMTAEQLREEGQRLARPCVWLRSQGPKDDFAAVWGGPGVVPPPKGPYRHWLTINCWAYKEFLHRNGLKIGPTQGCLSVYTDYDGGGAAVHDPKARLTDKHEGTRLYAHPGRCLPPIDAIFRLGSPAVQQWLQAQGWKPEWGYNNNFKDKKPVQQYDRAYRELNPIYGGLGGTPVHAMLGGWHFPWPEGDWAARIDRPLLVLTFEESEPWVEVWGKGKGFEVKQRVT